MVGGMIAPCEVGYPLKNKRYFAGTLEFSQQAIEVANSGPMLSIRRHSTKSCMHRHSTRQSARIFGLHQACHLLPPQVDHLRRDPDDERD